MRFENWEMILARCLREAEGKVFSWGEHDCCLWTADVVKAMTGVDYAMEFRGTYNTRAGAIRALIELADGSLTKLLDVFFDRVEVAYSQRGDVVVMFYDDMETLGVCVGDRAAFVTKRGLIYISMQNVLRAWAVT